jgi:two-component system CheB/CheR fusion protein
MDIGMPVMDGFEATGKILEINPNAKIVVQSAYAMADEKKRCFDIGCVDYLTKPIQKEALFETLEKWID